ncbi:MAG: DUF2330 domain-containing protein [Fimbriimonas sp.]
MSLIAAAALSVPCIHVGGHGKSVTTAFEHAVIVWDSKRGIEHFIRTAEFETNAKDFGFMVPTPSVPELAAADPAIFHTLDGIVDKKLSMISKGATAGSADATNAFGEVEVLKQQTVAGYDATVLKATSAGAAETWLKENGYSVTDSAREWLDPYVKKGWSITAFKIANVGAGHASLKPVRMSFATDKPFYPYREPRQERVGGLPRELELYVLSDDSVAGQFKGQGWSVQPTWTGELDSDERTRVASVLGKIEAQPAHLTVFNDHSNPRDGSDDVYFVTEQGSAANFGWLLPVVGLGAVAMYLLARRRHS